MILVSAADADRHLLAARATRRSTGMRLDVWVSFQRGLALTEYGGRERKSENVSADHNFTGTCYSAYYTSQTSDQKRFTIIAEVAADRLA